MHQIAQGADVHGMGDVLEMNQYTIRPDSENAVMHCNILAHCRIIFCQVSIA